LLFGFDEPTCSGLPWGLPWMTDFSRLNSASSLPALLPFFQGETLLATGQSYFFLVTKVFGASYQPQPTSLDCNPSAL